jgi:hypothetical protein
MPNADLTARIYDRLNEAGFPEHAQSRQHVAELAAGVVANYGTWPIGHYDTEDVERLINPAAHDAAAAACHAFHRFETATTPGTQAAALVDLCDKMGDLTSWLLSEDRELLDYGGEAPRDRLNEILRREARRGTEGNDAELAG